MRQGPCAAVTRMRRRRRSYASTWSAMATAIIVAMCSTTATTALSSIGVQQPNLKQQQVQWKPNTVALEDRRSLRRKEGGVSELTETIGTKGFHHIEFYCGDAKSMAYRFSSALGMPITGVTGKNTGNDQCVSFGLVSGDVRLLLTAPYSQQARQQVTASSSDSTTNSQPEPATSSFAPPAAPPIFTSEHPLPSFSPTDAHVFFQKHGLAAKAVGIEVKCAKESFENAVKNGARPVLEPTFLETCEGQKQQQQQQQPMGGTQTTKGCTISEIELYGDVVLRFVSFVNNDNHSLNIDESDTNTDNKNDLLTPPVPFLPHLAPMEEPIATRDTYGIRRMDHAVGNVPNLFDAITRIKDFSGFHEFAEFTSEDVGTIDSGLNSVVLASDNENVLLPINEPTQGTKRKSQIQTYLEQNEGAGLQHLALKTDDIFRTIAEMRKVYEESYGCAGFDLMKRPSDEYYRELPHRLGGNVLTVEQYQRLEELGILADADDEGLLLQIFTKPIGDRPTFFFEIIQRVGCLYVPTEEDSDDEAPDNDNGGDGDNRSDPNDMIQQERPGCGGFGQGNFRELFKAIEDHEKTLKV